MNAKELLDQVEQTYAGVGDYQTLTEVRSYNSRGSVDLKEFTYTFKKPHWIRLDFQKPHSGMVIVYPDENGEAIIRLAALAGFLRLHVAPDNPLLSTGSGQRIDETDLGLLIQNMIRSVTQWRHGAPEVEERGNRILITVLSDNHFRKGLLSLYEFVIDKQLHLPVEVRESTPDGTLERRVIFHNLRTNIGVPISYFQL
jgi:hypothetical protein